MLLWISDLWEYYLPYLYSGISLFGVLLLLCKLIWISITCRHRVYFSAFYCIFVCIFPQCALPLGCPECSVWPGASWSNQGCVKSPAFHLKSLYCGCNSHTNICWSLSVVGGCGRHFKLHHVRGRLPLEETELWVFSVYFHHVCVLFAVDIFSFKGECFFCVIVASTASCWVKLNMEAMQKEYQAVHNKRLSLGETEWRSSTSWVSVNRFIITFLSTSSQKCVGRHRRGNGTWATHWPC